MIATLSFGNRFCITFPISRKQFSGGCTGRGGLGWASASRSSPTGSERAPAGEVAVNVDGSGMEGEFLADFLKQWDREILLRLRVSSSALSGLPNFSVHDVFSSDQ